jgi:5-methylcytosine-specific restriction enzyme A
MPNQNWSDDELKHCIKAYFKMIKYDKDKTPYSKSEINKQLRENLLPNRSRSSIEYRMQNISAVLFDHSLKYLNGYLPANNVGANVKERIWKIIKDQGYSN